MTGKNSTRRFFAAKAGVAEAFIQMASKKNLTLYSLLSDVLGKVVDLDQQGSSLDETMRGFHLFKTSKETGLVSVPGKLWYETAGVSLSVDPEGTRHRFTEAGEWIGKYSLAKSGSNDPLRHLEACLTSLTNDSNDFSLEGNDTVNLRCVNPQYSQSYADSFSTLLSRAFESIGYECETRNVSGGMILLTFRKASQPTLKMRGEIFA